MGTCSEAGQGMHGWLVRGREKLDKLFCCNGEWRAAVVKIWKIHKIEIKSQVLEGM